MIPTYRAFPWIAALLFTSLATAQTNQPYTYPGYKAVTPPTIDGEISETEWPPETRREGFFDGDTGLPSDEKGEFWVMYDEEAIYFAGRAYTDPNKIQAEEYRQNVGLMGNDNFSLMIDPYGFGSDRNQFSANASGATSIRLAGGRAAKTEWLGEIEAKGRKTDTGWQVEMKIPWAIMSLPPAGKRDLKFVVGWYRSNRQGTYTHVFVNNESAKVPIWAGVEVPKVEKKRMLHLLPYTYVGVEEGEGAIVNGGVDMKSELSDSTTFVGTINPDFRNIENSILSLDFSYFERLGRESRPFFQEGENYFRTGFDQSLFASQRIDQIDTGFKAFGQVTPQLAVGAMSLFDFGRQQASVITLDYNPTVQSNIEFAYVGNEQPGARNHAGQLNLSMEQGRIGYYLNSQVTDDQVKGTGFRSSAGFRYSDHGFRGGIEYNMVTPAFYPRIGFSREQDLKGFLAHFGQEVTLAGGPISRYEFGLFTMTLDHFDGGFYRNSVGVESSVTLRNRISAEVGVEFSSFESSHDSIYSFEMGFPAGDPYRGIGIGYSAGEFQGTDYESIEINARYRPMPRVQLDLRSQWVSFVENENQHIFGLRYDIGSYESIGGRLVAENNDLNWYLSYRMSGKRGVEYFLLVGDPRAETFSNRVILKVVMPIAVKY